MKREKQKKFITEELTWEQHVICGNQSFESGRPDEALLEYERALILNPNNSLIYHNRGILYYNMEKNQEALLDYNKAIALNPQDSKIYNNRGNLYSDLARQEDALDDFNQAILLDPNFSDAYNSRAMLYVDLGKNHEALSDFDKAIQLKAQANVYKNRGILLFNLNRFNEALKDFNEAIRLTPKDSTSYLNAAIILQALNRNEEALEHYNQSIKLNSNDQRAYKSRAILYSNLGEIEQAISDLSQAILLNSDDFNTYYHRGNIIQLYIANQFWKQNQLNLALQDFNKSIRLNPKYQNAYDCRGNLYLELGDNSKAESDFNKSIELNSKSSNSYCLQTKKFQNQNGIEFLFKQQKFCFFMFQKSICFINFLFNFITQRKSKSLLFLLQIFKDEISTNISNNSTQLQNLIWNLLMQQYNNRGDEISKFQEIFQQAQAIIKKHQKIIKKPSTHKYIQIFYIKYQGQQQLDPYNSIYLINLGELHLKMNDTEQANIYLLQANSHLNVNNNSQLSQSKQMFNILQIVQKMLPTLLEIFTQIQKEKILIQNYPLESKVKSESLIEIKRIETSVENKLKTILQPLSLQSKQHQFHNQIVLLEEIILDIQINFSLIHQTLQKEQQLDIQEEQHSIQQLPNINIAKIQSEIANLKKLQNINKYTYFKSLCYNLISFMTFCFDIQEADKMLKENQMEKQEVFTNSLCTFKAEDYQIQNDLKESLFEIIFEALGYQENLKRTIIIRNFAQLYFIQNDFSEKLEIEFHLLAIELSLQQQEVPLINTFIESIEKISEIQMKEVTIASNIFWKKGILDSIKIIQFIDNNLDRIQSDGLQYLRMFKQEFEIEEVIVIHKSLSEQPIAVAHIQNEQPTYCSLCSIQ